jgi:brefeldin A-inhibited guanine nucleotide-exchange protein
MRYVHREAFETPNPIDAVPEVEHGMTTHDLFIKDAFLVFRALCKLTMKALNNERSAFFFMPTSPVLNHVTTVSAISNRTLCAPSCCLYTSS